MQKIIFSGFDVHWRLAVNLQVVAEFLFNFHQHLALFFVFSSSL